MTVRLATSDDVPDMVRLIEARRVEYEKLKPNFWRKAANSAEKSVTFFTVLVDHPAAVALVAEQGDEIAGFLIATETPVPPVYDGGPAATIDDFCVDDPSMWDGIGQDLLDRARSIGRERGWKQLIVVSGTEDRPKMEWLEAAGLAPTSSWLTETL